MNFEALRLAALPPDKRGEYGYEIVIGWRELAEEGFVELLNTPNGVECWITPAGEKALK